MNSAVIFQPPIRPADWAESGKLFGRISGFGGNGLVFIRDEWDFREFFWGMREFLGWKGKFYVLGRKFENFKICQNSKMKLCPKSELHGEHKNTLFVESGSTHLEFLSLLSTRCQLPEDEILLSPGKCAHFRRGRIVGRISAFSRADWGVGINFQSCMKVYHAKETWM